MKILIINAAGEKIYFKVVINNNSYTTEFTNSRENFDKIVVLLFEFLKKHQIEVNQLESVLINQGPGKFSSLRNTIAIAKALSVTNSSNLYGYQSNQLENNNYDKIIELFVEGKLKKKLIKPNYSS
tara:strand:+ start:490 stop:867 length:378 start_codon:yes stop_codon:yes gene_type:complete